MRRVAFVGEPAILVLLGWLTQRLCTYPLRHQACDKADEAYNSVQLRRLRPRKLPRQKPGNPHEQVYVTPDPKTPVPFLAIYLLL